LNLSYEKVIWVPVLFGAHIFFAQKLIYLFAHIRMNILIFGIDGGLGRGDLGSTDSIILVIINPVYYVLLKMDELL